MEWVYKKATDSWISVQTEGDLKLRVFLIGKKDDLSDIILIDIETSNSNKFLSMGWEILIEDIEAKKKAIEEILDISQYKGTSTEDLFNILRDKIIKEENIILGRIASEVKSEPLEDTLQASSFEPSPP